MFSNDLITVHWYTSAGARETYTDYFCDIEMKTRRYLEHFTMIYLLCVIKFSNFKLS